MGSAAQLTVDFYLIFFGFCVSSFCFQFRRSLLLPKNWNMSHKQYALYVFWILAYDSEPADKCVVWIGFECRSSWTWNKFEMQLALICYLRNKRLFKFKLKILGVTKTPIFSSSYFAIKHIFSKIILWSSCHVLRNSLFLFDANAWLNIDKSTDCVYENSTNWTNTQAYICSDIDIS